MSTTTQRPLPFDRRRLVVAPAQAAHYSEREHAEALIDDLRALIDMGLVRIEQAPGAPARYAPTELAESPGPGWEPAA
jgi:hypothetical protein